MTRARRRASTGGTSCAEAPGAHGRIGEKSEREDRQGVGLRSWGMRDEGGRHLVSSGVQNGGLDVLVEILWPRRADHLNVTVAQQRGQMARVGWRGRGCHTLDRQMNGVAAVARWLARLLSPGCVWVRRGRGSTSRAR